MWMPNHKLQINGNAQYWTGATFTNQASVPYDLKNTFVLNAALNYQLTSHFTAWVKGENLLDKPYERWANYPSLGVQFIAGVVYSFK
jgi:outer membrane receptor protein involved in Fe transport